MFVISSPRDLQCSREPEHLSPDKLLVAKQMFRQMLDDGVCRLYSSPWASLIHMNRKKNGEGFS